MNEKFDTDKLPTQSPAPPESVAPEPLLIAEAVAVSGDAVASSADEVAMPHSRLVARLLIISDKAATAPRAQVIKMPLPASAPRPVALRDGRSNAPKAPEAMRFGFDENSPMPLLKPPANHALARALMEIGHEVTLTGPYEWPLCFAMAAQDRVPEVAIIEVEPSARDIGAAVTLCYELQEHKNLGGLSILAALPEGETSGAALTLLAEAGIDDALPANASAAEIALRVGAAVTTARLRAELETTRDHLRTHLQTDDLTKLLNRRFFFQAAHREYGRARRYNHELSCLMIDVTHFKRFCSSFGYECGDAVLRTISNVLRDSTRDSDVLARFSEDKFVALLPETTIDGAVALRENVQRFLAESGFKWRGRSLPLEVSIGEASRSRAELSPIADEDWDSESDAPTSSLSLREEMAELLEAADAALYVAKRGTRNAPFMQDADAMQQLTPEEMRKISAPFED